MRTLHHFGMVGCMLSALACSAADETASSNGETLVPNQPYVVDLPKALGGQSETTFLASSAYPANAHTLPVGVTRNEPPSTGDDEPPPPPADVDISEWAPPVGRQQPYNDCACWVAGYSMLGWWTNRTHMGGGPFNPVFMFDQVLDQSTSCSAAKGTSLFDDIYFLKQVGIAPFSVYPSQTCVTPSSSQMQAAAAYKIRSMRQVLPNPTVTNEAAIKAVLASGKPVGLAIQLYNEFWNADAQNYIIGAPAAGSYYWGGHAVTALKYDSKGVWVVNSWGTGWGRSGWAELTWAFINGSDSRGAFVPEADMIDGMAGAGPCSMASDGNYCGQSTKSNFGPAMADTLYTCSHGAVANQVACSTGCAMAGPGFSDSCIVLYPNPPTSCGRIDADHGLGVGDSVSSCDGRFKLIMQSDGNLVLYQGSTPRWASNTVAKGHLALMQGDGNFVVYDGSTPGHGVFATGTNNHSGAYLAVQDDGNVVVYAGGSALWSSHTCCH